VSGVIFKPALGVLPRAACGVTFKTSLAWRKTMVRDNLPGRLGTANN
jgi:hypothetical protein